MKTIIKENHYQKRLWEDACFERDLKSGKFNDLLSDDAELEEHGEVNFKEVRHQYVESEGSKRTLPSLVGKFKFMCASRYAVSLARHYEMNVHVQVSDSQGIIELSSDEIMFDTAWYDGHWRRYFVRLFLFASSVCVQSKSENGSAFLLIWASFDLECRLTVN